MRLFMIFLLMFPSLSFAFDEGVCIPKTSDCLQRGGYVDGYFMKDLCVQYKDTYLCESKEKNDCEPYETNRKCYEVEGECTGENEFGSCKEMKKDFVCGSGEFVDECKEAAEHCMEEKRVCLHHDPASGECDHTEIHYRCTEEKSYKQGCKSKSYCIGGVCQKKQRSRHNDFGYAVSYLSILASMKSDDMDGCRCPGGRSSCDPSEIDPTSCKFFKALSHTCRKFTGELNCCGDRGFLRSFSGCNQEEKDLGEKRKGRLCHFVGSYKGKKLQFYKKWEAHCCFKSPLARIIQVEGRKQLGIGWGDAKHPDCRALTLAEIQHIDFSRIDFSELFADIQSKAMKSSEKLQSTMSNTSYYQSTARANTETITRKINRFYGGKS